MAVEFLLLFGSDVIVVVVIVFKKHCMGCKSMFWGVNCNGVGNALTFLYFKFPKEI